MNITKKALIFLLPATLWSIAGGAYALDCENIITSAQIDTCAKSKKESTDKTLNEIYKKLIIRIKEQYAPDPEMGERYLSKLRNSQRAWITLRDANCELESFLADPSSPAHETLTNNCITKMSRERSAYLDQTQP
ncbi:lysozyme inhibitor LprI family protein [Pseudomonas sp. MWU12-2345]|uniref:lysozyme inhibitor LprI family protein n=1 Tax=Pseudomonas sp. MWU12-2345 TaxID=2928689 RepID=UPI00200D5102|nr:lysozyme inhibitor LprI family protein [Pseudomonas sp. MWU12-2345]